MTIATNMAGRGTDIKPAAGGRRPPAACTCSAPSGTNRCASIASSPAAPAGRATPAVPVLPVAGRRAAGRAGTEAAREVEGVRQRGGDHDWNSYLYLFRRAQRRVESRHFRGRVDLLVHENQRQEMLKDIGADPYVD